MGEAIFTEEITNRYCFYPSSRYFTNRYCAVGALAFPNLTGSANYGSVVVLYEAKQFLLLWVWVKSHQTIFQRDNLEIFSAEVHYVLLASLQLSGAFLELCWCQNLALSSLLD